MLLILYDVKDCVCVRLVLHLYDEIAEPGSEDLNEWVRFGGEGRSRQEDAETFFCPGWAQPRQAPSPFFNQPRGCLLSQVRNCSE